MFDVSQENDTAASRTREALSRQMLKKGRKMGNYCGRHFPEIEGMNDYQCFSFFSVFSVPLW